MAKTVDNFSTIEQFRQTYNELATDVGTITGLQTPRQGNLVDALNSVNEKDFFFQEFIYVVDSQGDVNFSGNDNVGNLLKFRDDRIQVFVRGEHLIEGLDYVITSQNSDGTYGQINLQGDYANGGSKETEVNDRVIVYSYTGSYLGVAVSSTGSSFFQLSDTNSVYNNNQNGIILNGDSTSITSQLETGFTLQLAGKTFAEDDITLATGKTLTAPTVTDGTASLSSGSLTSAVNGTFSGTVTGGTLTDGTASITGGAISSATTGSFSGSVSAGTLTSSGDLSVTGNTTLNGNIDLGNASSDTITLTGSVDSDIISDANNTRSLGSNGNRWSDLYVVDVNASGSTTLSTVDINGGNIDGTTIGGTTPAAITGTTINGTTITANTITANTNFVGDLTGDVTGTVSSLSNHDTGDLTEGTNKYYTDARVDARMAGKDLNFFDDVNYTTTPQAGQILVWDNANQYWEPADQEDTDSIAEGSNNLYFTNERVDDRVNSLLTAGTGINLSYDDNADTLTITGSAQYGDSDVQSYLSGGAGLTLGGSGSFSVNTSNGVKIDGDDVELDYEVISSSSLGGSAPDGTGDAIGHLYFVI
jgi:hypothetical protein